MFVPADDMGLEDGGPLNWEVSMFFEDDIPDSALMKPRPALLTGLL